MQAFEDWLVGEVNDAERDARETHKLAMNSYGAGYDAGYVAALKIVLERMSPETAGTMIADD